MPLVEPGAKEFLIYFLVKNPGNFEILGASNEGSRTERSCRAKLWNWYNHTPGRAQKVIQALAEPSGACGRFVGA